MTTRAEERAPREPEVRTPDTGASDQFSGVPTEPGRRDELGRAGISPGTSASGEPDGVDVVIQGEPRAPDGREPEIVAESTNDPVTRREGDPAPDSAGSASSSWDWAEDNIVPEGLRSER